MRSSSHTHERWKSGNWRTPPLDLFEEVAKGRLSGTEGHLCGHRGASHPKATRSVNGCACEGVVKFSRASEALKPLQEELISGA